MAKGRKKDSRRKKGKSGSNSSDTTSETSKETEDKTAPDVIAPPPLAPPRSKPVASALAPVTLLIPTEEATPLPRAFQIQSADGHVYELEYPIFRNEFNAIFAVNAVKKSKVYAMKVELSKSKEDELERGGSLKMELTVMSRVAKIRKRIPTWGSHFLDMIDCGGCKNFRFVVSTLCGPNLKVLRNTILKRNFTMSAALLINYNTFNAIHDLHKIGYVHSVIRPTHFVIGTGDQNNVIYIIDFTRCTNPLTPLQPGEKPRVEKKAQTLKFMSRNVMDGKRCTFSDDLESWLYMSIDIVNDSLLPWNSNSKPEEMRRKKQLMFYRACSETDMDSSIPDEYSVIIDVLNSTRSNCPPKYERILSLLRDGLKLRNLNPEESWLNFVDKKKVDHPPLYSMQAEKLTPVTDEFLNNLFSGQNKSVPIKMSVMSKRDRLHAAEDTEVEKNIRHVIRAALAKTQSVEDEEEVEKKQKTPKK